MKDSEFITTLHAELEKLAASGQTTIAISRLNEALSAAIINPNNTVEPEQWSRELYKLQAPLQHASALEHYKSVLESGQTALKTLTTINGGAAVALLAFIGNVLTKGAPPGALSPIPTLKQAMLIFIIGVFCAGVSSGARYVAQFSSPRFSKTATAATACSILTGTTSLGAFLWGGIKAFQAF